MKRIILTMLVLSSAASADDGVLHQKITFNDLNLANAAGVEALYRRITTASQRVCDDHEGTERNLKRMFDIKKCLDTSTRQAIARVGSAALTRYYENKHGKAAGVKVAVTSK